MENQYEMPPHVLVYKAVKASGEKGVAYSKMLEMWPPYSEFDQYGYEEVVADVLGKLEIMGYIRSQYIGVDPAKLDGDVYYFAREGADDLL